MEFLLWSSVWEWDELRYINEKEWNRGNVAQKEEKGVQKYKSKNWYSELFGKYTRRLEDSVKTDFWKDCVSVNCT